MKSKRAIPAQVQPVVRCWIIEHLKPKGPYLILKSTKSGWLYLDGIEGCIRIRDTYQSERDAWKHLIWRFGHEIKFLKKRLANAKAQLLICDT